MPRAKEEVRVLLVDDQRLIAESVRHLLSGPLGNGWVFEYEEDASRALETARAFRPSVMLVDLVMPEVDGLDLLEEIRRDEQLESVPVVILTSMEDSDMKATAFEMGASDYVVKLPDSIEFEARLRHHAAGFLAASERDVADKRNEKLAEQLRKRNAELQERNKMFRLANDALKDEIDVKELRLKSIGLVGIELSEIQDLDILMQHILTEARRLVGAEAGAILTCDEDELVVQYAQNDAHEEAGRSAAALAGGYRVPISLDSISGTVVRTGEPINVDDVYSIPADAGYRFKTSYDDRTGYRTRALLSYPLRTASGDILGVIQLANPIMPDGERKYRFSHEDVALIRNFASIASVALERAWLIRSMIMRMIAMAETHDPEETGAHVNRVAGYSRHLFEAWARKKGMDQVELERRRDRLSIAAMLHDVGKIGIPDAILKKPGKLEPSEYAAMQMHTVIGARLFKGLQTDFDEVARMVALHHHERWDGTGYPGEADANELAESPPTAPIQKGLVGAETPIEARIVGLADVYEALSSKRSYKEAWPEEQVLEEIRSMSGKHFDPELVEIFLEHSDRMRAIRETWKG